MLPTMWHPGNGKTTGDNKEISVAGVRWKGRVYRQVTENFRQQNYHLASCNPVMNDKCPNPSNVQHQEWSLQYKLQVVGEEGGVK